MIKQLFLCIVLLSFYQITSAQSSYSEMIEAKPPVIALPFPVADGWTFVGDSTNTTHYPIYDSIVLIQWEVNFDLPYIAINELGFYGLLAVSERVDTIGEFMYDSLFYFGGNYFGLQDGSWTNWKLEWHYPIKEWKKQPFGKVDRWFHDESTLYFWQHGNMGMFDRHNFSSIPANYKYCRFFGEVEKQISSNEFSLQQTYLVSDGALFGLLIDNELVIPVVASNIQLWKDGYVRYWQNGWKYMRISDRKLIDPAGKDVVIYNATTWKIFNEDRTRSTLYLNNGSTVLSGVYEDYFVLKNNFIAVRKDSLIGLLNASGQLLFDCRCEQLDFLENERYSCLKKGKWYLMNEKGKQMSSRGFDHINPLLGAPNRYRIHSGNRVGVLDMDGKLIYQPIYKTVFTQKNLYLLENEDGFAVGNPTGELLSKHIYKYHYALSYEYQILVMYSIKEELDVFSLHGKLNSTPCNLFFYADHVLKCYEKTGLELVVLETDLSVSERIFYPGMISFEVGEIPESYRYLLSGGGYKRSHLEEHQLSGYFGYRFNWSTNHIQPPHFKEVTQNLSFGMDFCVESYEDTPFLINDSLQLNCQYKYQIVDEGSGMYEWEPMVSSTLPFPSAGGSSSDNRIIYYGNGSQEWFLGTTNHVHDADAVVYIDYNADDLYTYNTGGEIVTAREVKNSFSVFDFVQRYNMRGNLTMTKENIDHIMDPRNRLKVEGGSWFVDIDYTDRFKKISENLKGKQYESISFYNSWESNASTYLAKTANPTKFIWSYQNNDSILLDQFKEIETPISMNEYYVVTSANAEQAMVHPCNPDFSYKQYDENSAYKNGRILKKFITGWGIFSVKGEELVSPIYEEIRYLNRDIFAIRNEASWTLVSRDGVSLSNLFFADIENFENGYTLAKTTSSSVLIDSTLQVVFRSNEGTIKTMQNGLYIVENSVNTIVFDSKNQLTDTIFSYEKNLQNGWLYGKVKEQRYLRRLGNKERIFVKSTAPPEVIGELILLNKNGLFSVMKTNGMPLFAKNKKWKSFEKGDKMIALKADKEWCFVDFNGTIIHNCKKGKSLNYFNQYFVIEQQDTTYAVDYLGTIYTVSSKGINSLTIEEEGGSKLPASEFTIVQSDNGFGVVGANGEILVNPVHLSILGKQGEEFIVEEPSKKGVYNKSLKELIPVQFDEITGYDWRFFLVRNGNKYGICTASGEWFYPFHSK